MTEPPNQKHEYGRTMLSPVQPVKNDDDRPRLDLLPPCALTQIAQVLQFGAQKYSAYNYASGRGLRHGRLYRAAFSHLLKYWSGEDKDAESGLSHLAHAAASICMLLHLVDENKGEDDRFVGS